MWVCKHPPTLTSTYTNTQALQWHSNTFTQNYIQGALYGTDIFAFIGGTQKESTLMFGVLKQTVIL